MNTTCTAKVKNKELVDVEGTQVEWTGGQTRRVMWTQGQLHITAARKGADPSLLNQIKSNSVCTPLLWRQSCRLMWLIEQVKVYFQFIVINFVPVSVVMAKSTVHNLKMTPMWKTKKTMDNTVMCQTGHCQHPPGLTDLLRISATCDRIINSFFFF